MTAAREAGYGFVIMRGLSSTLQSSLQAKRVNAIAGMVVVTDRLDYPAIDQVFPLFAEQQFFIDELEPTRVLEADALEIGVGSGVLSIAVVRAGARHVTALEINPRAKNFAGFNFVVNGVEDRVSVVDGCADVFLPVARRRFDFVCSNPPFEPTPPGMNYFYHSAAGPYGLDFLDRIFAGLDDRLTERGSAQIVTAAPGDARAPTLLIELARQRLPGNTRIVVNPVSMTFDEIMDRLAAKQMGPASQIDDLRRRARNDGVTHIHLCVLHYTPGPRALSIEPSARAYHDFWDRPAEEVAL